VNEAACLRCGRQCNNYVVANFLMNSTVKKFRKSVKAAKVIGKSIGPFLTDDHLQHLQTNGDMSPLATPLQIRNLLLVLTLSIRNTLQFKILNHPFSVVDKQN